MSAANQMVVHSARKNQAVLSIGGKTVGSADYEIALRIRDLWNGQIALLGTTSSDEIVVELQRLAKFHRSNGTRKMHLYAEGAASRIQSDADKIAALVSALNGMLTFYGMDEEKGEMSEAVHNAARAAIAKAKEPTA